MLSRGPRTGRILSSNVEQAQKCQDSALKGPIKARSYRFVRITGLLYGGIEECVKNKLKKT